MPTTSQPMTSPLEKKFCLLWVHGIKGPSDITLEHKFHPSRKWRFDFAHVPSKTAIEIEGGIRKMGRHQRPEGFRNDAEKYFEAALLGWVVVRLTPNMINSEQLQRIVELIKSRPILN